MKDNAKREVASPLTAAFPWGYALAAVLPLECFGLMMLLAITGGPREGMVYGLWGTVIVAPMGALIAAWGVFRLCRGAAQQFPAMHWLVWIPAATALVFFIFT